MGKIAPLFIIFINETGNGSAQESASTAHQQVAKETEDEFGRRPLRLIYGGEQIVEKILKETSIILFAFGRASSVQTSSTHNYRSILKDRFLQKNIPKF